MERVGDIVGILSLAALSWQDFRSRQIAWWLLPLMGAGLLLAGMQRTDLAEIGRSFSINFTFLVLQLLLLWAWLSVKNRAPVKMLDTHIGWGDVLFLSCTALAFSPANFLVFYVCGTLLVLLAVIIAMLFRKSSGRPLIPLAGALGLPMIGLCAWRLIEPSANFFDDSWLVQLFDRI
jgi:Flp pilus assembly protein protease CpaA